jgi:hypothetical protein
MSYRRKRNNNKKNSAVDCFGALMVTFIFGLYFYNSLTKFKDYGKSSRNEVEKIITELRNRSLKIAQQLMNDPKLKEFTLTKTIKDWNNDKYLYFI